MSAPLPVAPTRLTLVNRRNARRVRSYHPTVYDNSTLNAYLAYEADNRRLAPPTIDLKRTVLKNLTLYLAPRLELPVDDPDVLLLAELSDLLAWQKQLRLSPAAHASYSTHARCFYAWASGRRSGRLIPENPALELPVRKVPRRVPRPMKSEDLFFALDMAVATDLRIYCWLMLGAACGLRCCEMAGLTGRSVEANERDQTVRITVIGKFSKQRIIDSGPGMLGALRPFMRTGGPLFTVTNQTTGQVQPMSANTLSRYLNKWLHDEAGIGDRTAHSLRHWFGTATYRERRDLRATQEAMGHASPVHTAGYADVVDGHGSGLGLITDRLLTSRGRRSQDGPGHGQVPQRQAGVGVDRRHSRRSGGVAGAGL